MGRKADPYKEVIIKILNISTSTYANYKRNKPLLFHFFHSFSIEQINDTIKDYGLSKNHNEKILDIASFEDKNSLKEEEIRHLDKNLYLTIPKNSSFQEIFKAKENSIKKDKEHQEYSQKIEEKREKEHEENKKKIEAAIKKGKQQLKYYITKYMETTKQYRNSKDKDKSKLLEKREEYFYKINYYDLSSVDPKTFPFTYIKKEDCEDLPSVKAILKSKNDTNVTLCEYDSKIYIHFLEKTKISFKKILDDNEIEFSNYLPEEVFDRTWEKLVKKWLVDNEDYILYFKDVNDEITLLQDLDLLDLDINKKNLEILYNYIKKECKIIIENYK